MVKTCCVWKCTNRASKDGSLPFHKFPTKSAERRRQWISAISREDENGKPWTPTVNDRVCGQHFVESDYQSHTKTKTLRPDSVPSVFPHYPASKTKPTAVKRPPPTERTLIQTQNKRLKVSDTVSSIQHDHCYAKLSISDELDKEKEKSKNLEAKLKSSQASLRALKKQANRQSRKFENLLKEVEDLHLLDSEQLDTIMANLSPETRQLFCNELKLSQTFPSGRRYPDELKSFAVTLHFYSPQAYEFLRKHMTLPDPSTIRRWASSLNCEPGFMMDVIEDMAKRLEEDSNRKDVCIMFDAMALKRECCYNGTTGKYSGFVNFGFETSSPDHLATEALVIMAVGLRGHWKQPIAYFLIDKLSADIQAQLVRAAIVQLTDRGFVVHAAVCDGNYTNQKTAVLLGCNLSSVSCSSSFPHPNPAATTSDVFFLFDACHLLKNFRNLIADLKVFRDSQDQLIRWKYIEELHTVQLKDNLHLANKLTSRHVDFINNKMNVKLAAQTLSSSVADAIDFLRDDLKLAQFAGSEPTTNFIRTIDKLFDICNSSSYIAKGFKAPLTMHNLSFRLTDLHNISKYLSQLTEDSPMRTPLSQGRRKTAVVGFLITIQSICGLSQRLLKRDSSPFRYLLTYKLSQDHLETLFSRIRRRGGWNNNPNTLQFKYVLRSCLLKNGIRASKGANCQDLPLSVEPPELTIIDQESPRKITTTDNDDIIQFIKLIQEPGLFHENVLFYIAGYMCRKLASLLKCTTCLSAISKRASSCDLRSNTAARLTLRKDRGGLLASHDIFIIVKTADSVLRKLILTTPLTSLQRDAVLKVQIETCKPLAGKLFDDLQQHFADTQDPLNGDHQVQIIKAVCQHFTILVMRHNANIMTQRFVRKNKGSVRHKLTKQILFLHQ